MTRAQTITGWAAFGFLAGCVVATMFPPVTWGETLVTGALGAVVVGLSSLASGLIAGKGYDRWRSQW